MKNKTQACNCLSINSHRRADISYFLFTGWQHVNYIRRVYNQATPDSNELLRDVLGRCRLACGNVRHANSRRLPCYR